MITIKELNIDLESAEKIIDLIKKHEPEIWNVLKEELKQAFSLNVVSHRRELFTDLLIWHKYNVSKDTIKTCE